MLGNDWVRSRKWPLLILPKTGLYFDCEMTVFPNFSEGKVRLIIPCGPGESRERESTVTAPAVITDLHDCLVEKNLKCVFTCFRE